MNLEKTQKIRLREEDLLDRRAARVHAAHPTGRADASARQTKSSAPQRSRTGTRSGGQTRSGGAEVRRTSGGRKRVSPRAMQRRRARRRRTMLHAFLILLLLASLGSIGVMVYRKAQEKPLTAGKKLSAEELIFFLDEKSHALGKTEVIEELADYEGYRVAYPVTGDAVTDPLIRSRAEDIATVFKAQVSNYRTDGRDSMTMVTDYIICSTGEEYLSVLFDVRSELPSEEVSGERIETYTYDRKTGEEVSLFKLFKTGYLEVLEEKVYAFAEQLAKERGSEVIPNSVEAEKRCFKYYLLDEEGLTLYYAGETLVKGVTELLSVEISYEELGAYLQVPVEKAGNVSAEKES